MMYWHQHFGTQFFTIWQQAGLPHHEPYLPEYFERLGQNPKQSDWVQIATSLQTGIDEAKLFGVYSFGVTVGKVLASLLNVEESVAEHTADWCGRFNAGISLFDYIRDEMGGAKRVTDLQEFQSFATAVHVMSAGLSPTESLLCALAKSVLHDLPHASPINSGNQNMHALFKRMQQLFEAEQMVCNRRLNAEVNVQEIRDALLLKSAGPFSLMAAYTAYNADPQNTALFNDACTLGNAIGHCYWLIDDAKDLKIDLDEGNWNLFLQMLAAHAPHFFAKPIRKQTFELVLATIEKENMAQMVAEQITGQLKRAIKDMAVDEATKQLALGLVSASLWQWYYY